MVSHNILASKLGHYSLDGWITAGARRLDYWTTCPVVSGTPQGSIQEPILFNTIYHMEEEMEPIFIDFFEDTKLECAVDLCEGSTQGR